MKTADVFTDGSCVSVIPVKGHSSARGYGGWCAVVEHGHEGWVLRGAEENTTAVRMELAAVANGLRSLPDGCRVRLWFDCTVILAIRDRLDHGRPLAGRDGDMWALVAVELRRLRVELRLIGKRDHIPQHQRAHTFAGAEAKRLREEVRAEIAPRLPNWALHKTA